MTRRILRGLAAAALLVALSAGAASAGGWATIQSDTGNPPQPNAGEPFTFGFTVLQHGVTPAGWEIPDIPRDQRRDGRAGRGQGGRPGRRRPLRRDGDAPLGRLLDVAGRAPDLIVETAPQPMAVALADGTMPAMDTGSMLSALERVRAELRTEYQAQLFTETDALRRQITQLDAEVAYL